MSRVQDQGFSMEDTQGLSAVADLEPFYSHDDDTKLYELLFSAGKMKISFRMKRNMGYLVQNNIMNTKNTPHPQ